MKKNDKRITSMNNIKNSVNPNSAIIQPPKSENITGKMLPAPVNPVHNALLSLVKQHLTVGLTCRGEAPAEHSVDRPSIMILAAQFIYLFMSHSINEFFHQLIVVEHFWPSSIIPYLR